MDDLFGLLGLFLILCAWIPEVLETIRTKRAGMKMEFIVLYFFGSLSLVFYAWQLGAVPFMILNLLAAIVPLINLYYHITQK